MYYEQTVVPNKMLRDWCGWPHGRFPVWILNSPNHSVETEQLMRTVNMVSVVKQPGNIYVLLHTWVDITVVHTNVIFVTVISIETGSYSCSQLHPLLTHISVMIFILKPGFLHMCAGLCRQIELFLFLSVYTNNWRLLSCQIFTNSSRTTKQ
jgi:hypothetical protein